MKRSHDVPLFIGTNGHVRAVDKRTGKDIWEVSLPDTGFEIVSLLYESGILFAGSNGYLFALNPKDGAIQWTNELEGLGHEHMVLASAGGSTDPVLLQARLEEMEKEEEDAEDLAESLKERKK